MTVIAPARELSDLQERRLSEFRMVQEYSEEQRRAKAESGKGKGKRRYMPPKHAARVTVNAGFSQGTS